MIRPDRRSAFGSLKFASLLYGPAGLKDPVSRRPRVLLAEDDAEMRAMLRSELRRDAYEVLEVSDGAEAAVLLSAMRNAPDEAPDVIIMDIRMPSRTGLEVLADLRKYDCHVPVVLITAFGARDVHEKARQLGAVAVFDKPFDVDDLRTALLNCRPSAPAA